MEKKCRIRHQCNLGPPDIPLTEAPEIAADRLQKGAEDPQRKLTIAENQIWKDLPEAERRIATATVAKLHADLGHSSIRQMIGSLRLRSAHPSIIAAAKLYHCSACYESERRRLRPVTSGNIYEPGSHLAGDQFEWVHPTKDLRVLGTIFVDNGSRTAVIHIHAQGTTTERLGNITGEVAAETLRSHWTKYYGRPDVFHSDPEGCFASNAFKERLAAMTIKFLPEPGEAAWRIGILDKTLDTLKESATRSARRVAEDVPVQQLFDMCCEAHNDVHRTRGSSPLQLLIGRTPKGVGLEAERSLGQRSAEITDTVERSRLEVKTECYKAYVE